MKASISGILTGLLCLFVMIAQAKDNGGIRGPVRGSLDVANPNVQNWVQSSGSIRINLTNRGFIGNDNPHSSDWMSDPCTGDWAPQTEFPIRSGQNYLFQAALWIGAEVLETEERTPRVSVGTDGWSSPSIIEMYPGEGSDGDVVLRSNLPDAEDCFGNSIYDSEARAHFESIATYSDTLTDEFWVNVDPLDYPHEPLHLKITQSVLTWNCVEFSDLAIFEYTVENIGDLSLQNLYLGMYVDADIGIWDQLEHHTDDITGFLRYDPETGDTLNIGWAADNDGRSPAVSSGPLEVSHCLGLMALELPDNPLRASYNWWVSNSERDMDYGPSWISYADDDSLGMGWTQLYGTPIRDVHKYDLLRNGEQDFDVVYLGDEEWIEANPQLSYDPICNRELDQAWHIEYPPNMGYEGGFDTRFLMSWGPIGIFDYTDANGCHVYRLNPGEEFTFAFAFLLGKDFHDADNPQPSNNHLDPSLFDFTGLIESARAAKYIFEHNYPELVSSPTAFTPTASADGVVPLSWVPPTMGVVDHYELRGINQRTPSDTLLLAEIPASETAYIVTSLSNGEDWRLLLRTVDVEGYHSAYADTLVRVGAVPTVDNLTAELDDATVHLNWDARNDPALVEYTIARRSSRGDSITFTTVDNSYTDNSTVSGRHYDYWVMTESTHGVTGLPTELVSVLPFGPDIRILVIDEYKEWALIDSLRGGIHPDSVTAVYNTLMDSLGYDYTLIRQNREDTLAFDLETLAQYDLVFWHSESNVLMSTQLNGEREAVFQEYLTAGGTMIRAGRNLLHSDFSLYGDYPVLEDLLPLELDSVRVAYLQPISPDFLFTGAASLDVRFPDLTINQERASQLVWGGSHLDLLSSVDLFWPRVDTKTLYADTKPLYTVITEPMDSLGYYGEPCAVVHEQVVLLGFSLYFVEEEQAVHLLRAAVHGLRVNAFAPPEPPDVLIPSSIKLHQNYPNPFNPTTTISFSIPAAEQVTLKVYDIMGREVTTLLNKRMERGTYNIDFNGGNYASGLYFYRLQAGSELQTRKMVLLK